MVFSDWNRERRPENAFCRICSHRDETRFEIDQPNIDRSLDHEKTIKIKKSGCAILRRPGCRRALARGLLRRVRDAAAARASGPLGEPASSLRGTRREFAPGGAASRRT